MYLRGLIKSLLVTTLLVGSTTWPSYAQNEPSCILADTASPTYEIVVSSDSENQELAQAVCHVLQRQQDSFGQSLFGSSTVIYDPVPADGGSTGSSPTRTCFFHIVELGGLDVVAADVYNLADTDANARQVCQNLSHIYKVLDNNANPFS
jgi:hypothetical protein